VSDLKPKPDDKKAVDEMGLLILAIAANQDRAAFRRLFDHFAPRIKAFIIGQRTDPSMAEEVVQETLVNVWRKAKLFDPQKASAATWIFTIARNLRVDLIRKSNRPEPDVNDPTYLPEPDISAADQLSKSQDANQLRQTIEQLPDEQQAVLRLAFFEEKSHPEVALTLGVPLGTVKSRIRLALKRLRLEIGENQ